MQAPQSALGTGARAEAIGELVAARRLGLLPAFGRPVAEEQEPVRASGRTERRHQHPHRGGRAGEFVGPEVGVDQLDQMGTGQRRECRCDTHPRPYAVRQPHREILRFRENLARRGPGCGEGRRLGGAQPRGERELGPLLVQAEESGQAGEQPYRRVRGQPGHLINTGIYPRASGSQLVVLAEGQELVDRRDDPPRTFSRCFLRIGQCEFPLEFPQHPVSPPESRLFPD